MNGEYAGFFDIGMVQRNEKNAIIAHGTMCLIRRSALVAAGNWSSGKKTPSATPLVRLFRTKYCPPRRTGLNIRNRDS